MHSVLIIFVWLAADLVLESEGNYSPWRLDNMTGLYCQDSCDQDKKCCSCKNKRAWQLEDRIEADLHIRYTDIRGSSVVYIHSDVSDYNHTRLDYINERLRKIPSNICDFPTIVELVLDNNEIENLDGLSCLSNLDTLSLNHNNLEIIRNTTFRSLSSLRSLFLKNNKIVDIEPNSFKLCCGQSILNIDVSNNKLDSVDVTNFVLKAFCEISYSNNTDMLDIKNELNFTLKPEEVYGSGGRINFEKCSFSSFFNCSDFGLDSWSDMFKHFDVSVAFTSFKLTCDCNIAELFAGDTGFLGKFLEEYSGYVCEQPPELNGTKLTDNFLEHPEKHDLMVCNITESCPQKCRCYNQPSQDRVVVDCQNQNLTTMPQFLPWGNGDKWRLLLAGNNIQKIEDRYYLSRIAELDLSENPVYYISESAAFALPREAQINIIGNKLTSLPRPFQNRDPSTLSLGRVLITCSCEDVWLQSWLSYHSYEDNETSYICQNLGGSEITVADFSSLHCSSDSSNLVIILVSLIGLLATIISVIVCRLFFFPEVYVLYRRKLRRVRKSCGFDYDAYISFYEEDTLQRKWIIGSLAGHLESRGYSLFIPVRDTDPGVSRQDYLRSQIQRSKNFIIILSEKYFNPPKNCQTNETMGQSQNLWSEFEFNIIWKIYRSDIRRNLIIVNFDSLSASEISHRWVKAFCRVGEIEDFTERRGSLLNAIERQLYTHKKYDDDNSTGCDRDNVTVTDLHR
ncbi:toll-like receptor 7 [Argopecten irradians]|uniref:toll-like receptor 7 n=1 Tax=Argopecten irradians TaxID=31199 RepID=UPI00372489A7